MNERKGEKELAEEESSLPPFSLPLSTNQRALKSPGEEEQAGGEDGKSLAK